jgi:DNA-binding NtrC family response regulator
VEHVLLVEDEPMLRKMFCTFLRAEGYIVEEASSVDRAKSIIDTEIIDIVISDLKLGLQSAEDLYQWILGKYPDMRDRFIVISGWPEVEGFPYFLPKPFHIDALLELLNVALGRPSRVELAQMGKVGGARL